MNPLDQVLRSEQMLPPVPGGPPPASPWGPSPTWSPGWPEWVWYLVAGTLALVVLWLLWLAVWRGRSRGRARCPGCWYDMSGHASGEPPFTCPECGRLVRKSRGLHRIRVRWLGLAAACLGGVVCAAALLMPSVDRNGLVILAPTRVLIGQMEYTVQMKPGKGLDRIMISRVLGSSHVESELEQRLAAGTLSRGDWRKFLAVTRTLHPEVLRQHTPHTPYVTMAYPRRSAIDLINCRVVARVTDIETDGPRTPYPHPSFEGILPAWIWLREGDELHFNGRFVSSEGPPPVPLLYGAVEPNPRPHAGFYVANNTLAITFEVEVHSQTAPNRGEFKEPIRLGRMRIEFPASYRDESVWAEVYADDYANPPFSTVPLPWP